MFKKIIIIAFILGFIPLVASEKAPSKEQEKFTDEQVKASLATIDKASTTLKACSNLADDTGSMISREKSAAQAIEDSLKSARELQSTLKAIK